MAFENGEIDPVKYGVLWQKVQDMDKKMDKLERNVEELVELANKSKGGLWVAAGWLGFAVWQAFKESVHK